MQSSTEHSDAGLAGMYRRNLYAVDCFGQRRLHVLRKGRTNGPSCFTGLYGGRHCPRRPGHHITRCRCHRQRLTCPGCHLRPRFGLVLLGGFNHDVHSLHQRTSAHPGNRGAARAPRQGHGHGRQCQPGGVGYSHRRSDPTTGVHQFAVARSNGGRLAVVHLRVNGHGHCGIPVQARLQCLHCMHLAQGLHQRSQRSRHLHGGSEGQRWKHLYCHQECDGVRCRHSTTSCIRGPGCRHLWSREVHHVVGQRSSHHLRHQGWHCAHDVESRVLGPDSVDVADPEVLRAGHRRKFLGCGHADVRTGQHRSNPDRGTRGRSLCLGTTCHYVLERTGKHLLHHRWHHPATTASGSTKSYTAPFALTGNTTVKALAVDAYGNPSAVTSRAYTVLDTTPPVVTVTPPAGSYPANQQITLAANEVGASIYFTTNGTNPTATAANKYSTAITLTSAMTLKYFAVDTSNNSSAIVTQAYTVTAPPANTWKDYTGDAKNDVVARDNSGTLWLYPGNGSGGWLAQRSLGTGWNSLNAIVPTKDFNGDGRSDVLARDTNGVLWLYPGNGSGGLQTRVQAGTAWSGKTLILAPGDFSGDGKADVLARDSAGILWLHRGNGTGGFASSAQVGTGWNSMNAILSTGDFNGDSKTDVLARDTSGILWLYPGNGTGGWLSRVQVGSGWSGMTAILGPGDFNGDGKNDVLARDAGGNLFLYPGNGTSGWLSRSQVGWGWGGFTSLP
ncbi:hypothetical protein CGK93_15465 [Arthrobacter sp. YN]|nr:hypothetical protein CGK93_15465 [Arthrobacter sp. YN]